MAYSNSHVHPLDQHFVLLLRTLQLNDFIDHYRGKVVLSDDDDEVLNSHSPHLLRREKIIRLVKIAKVKDPELKNFLWALKTSDQSMHKDLMEKLQSALKEMSESRRETVDIDNETKGMIRSLSSLSLDNYDRKVDVASDFSQICCSGCTSPINIIGDTSDFIDVYKRTNPRGYVHRFYTLQGISTMCRIKRDGTWHKEHTWFEDFWWMIIYCKNCEDHLGWHYENYDGSKSFYGILKKAVCLRAKKD